MQQTLVILILLGCLCYAAWRVWQVLKQKNDPCCGCELKKNCKKFCDLKEK